MPKKPARQRRKFAHWVRDVPTEEVPTHAIIDADKRMAMDAWVLAGRPNWTIRQFCTLTEQGHRWVYASTNVPVATRLRVPCELRADALCVEVGYFDGKDWQGEGARCTSFYDAHLDVTRRVSKHGTGQRLAVPLDRLTDVTAQTFSPAGTSPADLDPLPEFKRAKAS